MTRTIILLAAVLTLALIVLQRSPAQPPPSPDQTSVLVQSADSPAAPVTALPQAASGIRSRIFLIREDTPEPAQAPSAASVPSDANIRLIGIARGPSGGTALLVVDASPDVQRRKVGERIEDWTIIAMEARSVTLASGDRRQTLRLDAP